MIKYLFKKQKTIGGAALLLAFFTIIAQFLGIVKNKLLAVQFGASEELDIFYTAFKIPDVIFLLIGTMAVGAILIPIFAEKENISIQEGEKYMTRFFNSFSVFIILISGITFFLLPFILNKIFPAFQGESMESLLTLSRILLLSPILMGVSNFFISVNQKNKIFLPMALTGVFYNLWIIFGILILSPYFGIMGLGYGVIIGALFHLLIQLPSIFKHNLFKYKFKFLEKNEIFDLLKITLPRSVALSISTVVLIYFYSRVSSLRVDGLITIFAFAYAVFWIPVALLNSSYSAASLPVLAKFFSQKKCEDFKKLIKNMFSQIFFFAVPISIFFFVFSDLIVATLFGSEKFSIKEINSTAIILSLFSIMIIFQILLLVISRIYYSMGKTKPVMYVNIFAGLLIILLFNLSNQFNWNNYVSDLNVVGSFSELFKLTLIFVISYISASVFIIFKLIRSLKGKNVFNFPRLGKKIFVSFISIIILQFISKKMDLDVSLSDGQNFKNIFIIGLLFIILFIIFSELMKEENYLEFKERFFNKFKNKKK